MTESTLANSTLETDLLELRSVFLTTIIDALKSPNPKAQVLDVAERILSRAGLLKVKEPVPPVDPASLPQFTETPAQEKPKPPQLVPIEGLPTFPDSGEY